MHPSVPIIIKGLHSCVEQGKLILHPWRIVPAFDPQCFSSIFVLKVRIFWVPLASEETTLKQQEYITHTSKLQIKMKQECFQNPGSIAIFFSFFPTKRRVQFQVDALSSLYKGYSYICLLNFAHFLVCVFNYKKLVLILQFETGFCIK